MYASGDHFIVETDVVLPATTGLTRAHNCAESAQCTFIPISPRLFLGLDRWREWVLMMVYYTDGLEQLEGVERAYIHVDVTSNNLSGHLPR